MTDLELVSAESDATFSDDGVYRYTLTRTWSAGRRACWVMLNPSTADAAQDDPTIRRCIAFSKAWGFGSLVVVNLWAARSTDPKHLLTLADPCGPGNAEVVGEAVVSSDLAVAAWGTNVDKMAARGHERIRPENVGPMFCLGTTKAGHPRHPLYVKGAAAVLPWPSTEEQP